MVFIESFGDNDFRSVYKSVDEEISEREERIQTEKFLQLLDEIDQRETEKHVMSSDSESEDDDDYMDYIEYRKQKKRKKLNKIRRRGKVKKEFMKVSIVDDENMRKENKKEEERKRDFHGKVHTLDDLPPDESEFYKIFGSSMLPDPPEVNIEAGRRLKDGKVVYSARFPENMFEGLEFNGFSIEVEYVLIAFLLVFLAGIYLGKFTSGIKHRREITQLKTKYQSHINSIQSRPLPPPPQPMYIPAANMYQHVPPLKPIEIQQNTNTN